MVFGSGFLDSDLVISDGLHWDIYCIMLKAKGCQWWVEVCGGSFVVL